MVVHHVGDADVKLQKIAKQVQAPFGSLLMMAKGTVGISKGLDEKGDAAMIVMSRKDAEEPAGGDETTKVGRQSRVRAGAGPWCWRCR